MKKGAWLLNGSANPLGMIRRMNFHAWLHISFIRAEIGILEDITTNKDEGSSITFEEQKLISTR
jgi:hypothetical protein